MKPIIITGSSGLIGTALARRLSRSYPVVGMDLVSPGRASKKMEWLEVNFESDRSVKKALEKVRADHGPILSSVIHLAAFYDFSGEPSAKYETITVRGTERLLGGLQSMDLTVEQFLFSSTMLVHAPCEPGQRINEDSPLDPTWDYPRSKLEAEHVLRRIHGSIPLVLLRIAGVYDDFGHSPPLANQIQRINERWVTSRAYPGDVSRGQSFIHLDDLVESICRLVEFRSGLPQESTLLVGEPETMSYDEIQRILGRLIHGEEWETHQIPKSVAKTGAWLQDHMPLTEPPFIKPWMVDRADDHFALDVRRIQDLVGWRPRHTLRETLPRMVASLKRNPEEWYQGNKLTMPSSMRKKAA